MTSTIAVSAHTLLCAVRWALGKPHYVTDGVMVDVVTNVHALSIDERRQVIQDIDTAIVMAAAGTAPDVQRWQAVQAAMR